jgi:hypothetical protein
LMRKRSDQEPGDDLQWCLSARWRDSGMAASQTTHRHDDHLA